MNHVYDVKVECGFKSQFYLLKEKVVTIKNDMLYTVSNLGIYGMRNSATHTL